MLGGFPVVVSVLISDTGHPEVTTSDPLFTCGLFCSAVWSEY